MHSKLFAAVAAAVFLASNFVLAGAARAQQPIIIKFSHVVSPDAPKGKAAVVFKDLAEKYTNGRVKVEIYPNSSLYKDKEELEALQLGSVQILALDLQVRAKAEPGVFHGQVEPAGNFLERGRADDRWSRRLGVVWKSRLAVLHQSHAQPEVLAQPRFKRDALALDFESAHLA